MPNALNAPDVLNREFLEIRARILDLAAMLDRLDRAPGDVSSDRRIQLIQKGIDALKQSEPNRAEQVQLIFSLAYDPKWRETLAVQRR
jgi:hypothetical protein